MITSRYGGGITMGVHLALPVERSGVSFPREAPNHLTRLLITPDALDDHKKQSE